MTHGLVIGKFYPPHAGHHHLIDTAAAACDRLSVVVAASPVESVPLADRVAWLRETHPQPHVHFVPVLDDVEVDYDDQDVWRRHVEIFRHGLRLLWGDEPGIDAVFSSEAYGKELARWFGAVAHDVDEPRGTFPVSGTAVRADPVAHWHFLAPPVRAALARRVVVVGAESTGTTTLARALAAHYAGLGGPYAATRWVPEYGRTYCEERVGGLGPGAWLDDIEWTPADFALIAERQLDWEDAAARVGSPVLICDTDAFATALWRERYLGELGRIPARARHDLWILTDHEGVPFEQDGWRDGESVRVRMAGRFRAELDRRRLPYVMVTGPHERRLAAAVTAVDRLLARGWTFAPPL
ncbi:AAA family ATPase [Spirillospora sp. NPDC047279]|uniref:AAA family ATPase n=1 Tax=Spirillospora sp. NPDC047279 TaxID=3155478 RepID=UPI0033EE7B90